MTAAAKRTSTHLGAVLAVEHPRADDGMIAVLARMAETTGVAPMKLMRDVAGLSFGPGKVSFADYTRLRLYDEAFWAGADRRAVVGQRRNRDLMVQANHRHDWYGLAANKLAANAFLAAYGFPVIPTRAVFAQDLAAPSPSVLRSRGALTEFLSDPSSYPLFGKPAEGLQSLGAAAFVGFDAASGMLQGADGGLMALGDFVDQVCAHYGAGYVFQPMLRPHREVGRLSGGRLATVRLVTIASPDGPRLLRACWKMPAGGNVADNYWRPGNLLAQLDLASGRVLRVTRGSGLDLEELDAHPDTGAPLVGACVPDWAAMKTTAVEAARLVRRLGVIGWDMAPAEAGPVIVEMNETPDLFLNQLADRRGMLDADFLTFLAEQKTAASAHLEGTRAEISRL